MYVKSHIFYVPLLQLKMPQRVATKRESAQSQQRKQRKTATRRKTASSRRTTAGKTESSRRKTASSRRKTARRKTTSAQRAQRAQRAPRPVKLLKRTAKGVLRASARAAYMMGAREGDRTVYADGTVKCMRMRQNANGTTSPYWAKC